MTAATQPLSFATLAAVTDDRAFAELTFRVYKLREAAKNDPNQIGRYTTLSREFNEVKRQRAANAARGM